MTYPQLPETEEVARHFVTALPTLKSLRSRIAAGRSRMSFPNPYAPAS